MIEIRLQRIVPHVISLLNEESALLRATSLKVLTDVVIISIYLNKDGLNICP
jgi:hypothetical protein